MEKFSQVLSGFPENHRRIMTYRIRDELDYDEIARKIGKSYDATRVLYGRCLKKLIDQMQEKEDTGKKHDPGGRNGSGRNDNGNRAGGSAT